MLVLAAKTIALNFIFGVAFGVGIQTGIIVTKKLQTES
jgi:hypothetical protein